MVQMVTDMYVDTETHMYIHVCARSRMYNTYRHVRTARRGCTRAEAVKETRADAPTTTLTGG